MVSLETFVANLHVTWENHEQTLRGQRVSYFTLTDRSEGEVEIEVFKEKCLRSPLEEEQETVCGVYRPKLWDRPRVKPYR